MKIVQINATCGVGSTGKICSAVATLLDKENIENYIFYSSGHSADIHGRKYLSNLNVKLQAFRSRILGNYGLNTVLSTKRLLKEIDKISPDIIHLHNLHAHNVNLNLLFKYFKRHKNIKIFWTFHDCWAFTGYCPHFTMVKCDKWKTGCKKCPQKKEYTWFFDGSNKLYNKKKELFSNLNMTIITPSRWLADLVKQSFLAQYPVKVINNGIDLTVFNPTESNFRERYEIGNKYIVLGVAFGWEKRKGLDVFVELANRLDEQYQIILVGTDDEVDKQLPRNIISIHRTQNQKELAEIYTASDVFVNPTREENYPTVNMEALACGTPVITFATGGSAEILDESCGTVVPCDDVQALQYSIQQVCERGVLKRQDCIRRAQCFDNQIAYRKYLNEYNI